MSVKLLIEHHLEFLSLKGGYRCSSESTLVKMSNCWKSHAAAQILIYLRVFFRFEFHLAAKRNAPLACASVICCYLHAFVLSEFWTPVQSRGVKMATFAKGNNLIFLKIHQVIYLSFSIS